MSTSHLSTSIVATSHTKTAIVATWGAFDCLHDGHKKFLLKASEFGKLNVIIIPSQIKFINKGYYPIKNEFDRKNDLLYFGKILHKNVI